MLALFTSQTGLLVGARTASPIMRRGAMFMSTLHDFKSPAIDGKETALSSFKGKPVLILNVASL